jgi:glucose-1-phosphate thymidylyltransferase
VITIRADFVGVLPAAGRAARLAPFRYPKELLPIVYAPSELDDGLRPRAVIEYSLAAVAAAGVRRTLIVIAPWKSDLVGCLGDGQAHDTEIGYVCQDEPLGLPHAIDRAHPWTSGNHVVFAMPDTIFTPTDAIARLRERYLDARADLALAVFPTDQAWRLGPVVTQDGAVVRVLDKPDLPPVANTWGAAIWGDAFADLLHAQARATESETTAPALGELFDQAVRSGLNVAALEFTHGSFEDIGTPTGILRCLDGAGRR